MICFYGSTFWSCFVVFSVVLLCRELSSSAVAGRWPCCHEPVALLSLATWAMLLIPVFLLFSCFFFFLLSMSCPGGSVADVMGRKVRQYLFGSVQCAWQCSGGVILAVAWQCGGVLLAVWVIVRFFVRMFTQSSLAPILFLVSPLTSHLLLAACTAIIMPDPSACVCYLVWLHSVCMHTNIHVQYHIHTRCIGQIFFPVVCIFLLQSYMYI